MLDIKFIRDNVLLVQENINNRGMKANALLVPEIYSKRNSSLKNIEALRAERNEASQKMKEKLTEDERRKLIERGRLIKDEISKLEIEEKQLNDELFQLVRSIPNMTHPEVPIGLEGEGKTLEVIGIKPEFSFEPKDHLTLGNELKLFDFESAAEVSGQKFYYLLNDGAMLELALVNYAMNKLVSKGFTPVITPDLARVNILEAIGFNPRGDETQVYSVADTDLCLIGTSEITLGGMLRDKILRKEDLPIKYVGFSHCFRTEAGASGAESRGLYRVHQFSKVEMFAFTNQNESEQTHLELKEIEKEIFSELGLYFRVVDIPTGDLGSPAYRKYDIEAWMPSRGDFGEVTSTSNCTDYQSRRLNIKYRDENNDLQFVHTLNGTAIAVSRAILGIIENFQLEDGTIIIPEVLRPYMGGRDKIVKK